MYAIQYVNQSNHSNQYIGQGKRIKLHQGDTICSFFARQLQQSPNKIAVRFYEDYLTYTELEKQSNQLANYLLSQGLLPDNAVGVYLKPNLQLLVVILAILKAGCSYVPLDTNYPIDRINFMIKDSGAQILITESDVLKKLSITDGSLVVMNQLESVLKEQSADFTPQAKADSLAYIIYTSGSTGVPKGVKISHRAVNNHMLWMADEFQFDESEKILQKTPLSFDPSVWEMFISFYTGSELVIAPSGSHMDPEGIIDLILQHQITTVQLVPSILKLFLNSKRVQECQSLRHVFVGGESLRPEIKKQFFEKLSCQLINLYGPTEATIDITFHIVTPSDAHINTNIIGKPVANTSLYVMNKMFDLVNVGEEGELYIASDSLSSGYHNRDALTQDHFVANPFESHQYKKMYKTGDLVRWLPTGELEYLGRNNDQVKINGVRIEPKELVLSILEHPSVSDCIVIKKVDTHGHDYLACYLTHKPHVKLNISAIKESLKGKFPAYMLPRVYMPINKIPLTVNGKVDSKALPEPNFERSTMDTKAQKILEADEYELLLIWQKVLETNQIDVNDDFFDAGGGSLLALKLIALIHEKFHVSVRIRDIFTYSTIKEQLKLIKNQMNPTSANNKVDSPAIPDPVICLQPHGTKTPLFLIHPIGGTVFWFSHLAKLMGTSRPIYAIQDPSIDLEKPVLNSIEEMANFYLSHIKKIQPTGPYLLGGASFGATVAVEMSRQLKKTNEDVSSLIILDGWGVYPNTLLDNDYFRNSMLRQHAELLADFKKYGLPAPEVLFDIQWFRLNLLWKYQLDLIESPIALFKSEEILTAFEEIDAPHNHWEEFSNGAITTAVVPGNHETMFQEPHVYRLCDELDLYLEKHNL